MILQDFEETYLRGLQESPVWIGILKKLATAKTPPRYTPTKKEQNYDLWVYESGGIAATEAILSLLALTEVKLEENNER